MLYILRKHRGSGRFGDATFIFNHPTLDLSDEEFTAIVASVMKEVDNGDDIDMGDVIDGLCEKGFEIPDSVSYGDWDEAETLAFKN